MDIELSEWLTTFGSIWMLSMGTKTMGVSMMGQPLFFGNGQKETTNNGKSCPINASLGINSTFIKHHWKAIYEVFDMFVMLVLTYCCILVLLLSMALLVNFNPWGLIG